MAARSFLVVDPDKFLREALATLLDLLGLEVSVAETAEEAVALARGRRPSAVILDDWLPSDRDQRVARRAMAELRECPATRDVPIVALTDSPSRTRSDHPEWLPYRPDDVLVMPCQPSDVWATLGKYRAVVPTAP